MSVKLKIILFFVQLVVLVVISFFGALLYFGEEVTKNASAHVGGALVLAGTLYLWRRFMSTNKSAAGVDIKFWWKAGLLVLGLPLIYYTFMGSKGVFHIAQLAMFERSVKIENYREELVKWPGFEQAVGLRITFDLVYPYVINGKLYHPKILVGDQALSAMGDAQKAYWDFCADPYKQDTACLSYPVWPMRALPELTSAERLTLSYDLYPSNLYHLENQANVCLRKRYPYGKQEFLTGEVGFLWPLGNSHRHIQLGALLESVMKEKSEALRSAETMKNLFSNMQSQGLLGAGYQSCEIKQAIRFPEESGCFCVPPDEDKGGEKKESSK